MALFSPTLTYSRCKHGVADFDCEECAYEQRRTRAKEDALAVVEEMKREMRRYGNHGILFYLDRLEDALNEMEV